MSASLVLKFSESMRGHFEDFWEVECLVGDICTDKHTAEKQVQNTKQEHKID